jgi:hypothetical protein
MACPAPGGGRAVATLQRIRCARPKWRNGRRSGPKLRGAQAHPSSNLGFGTIVSRTKPGPDAGLRGCWRRCCTHGAATSARSGRRSTDQPRAKLPERRDPLGQEREGHLVQHRHCKKRHDHDDCDHLDHGPVPPSWSRRLAGLSPGALSARRDGGLSRIALTWTCGPKGRRQSSRLNADREAVRRLGGQ